MEQNITPPPPTNSNGPPPVGPPPVTPGWNDPPEIPQSHSSSSRSSAPKRILNKRVAFPLTSSKASNEHGDVDNSNKMLQEIVDNITFAINQLPDNAVLRDMDRMSINWHEPSCSNEIKELLFNASKHIRHRNMTEVENIHKQLSAIPAAGWFTLFLHSTITSLSSQTQS